MNDHDLDLLMRGTGALVIHLVILIGGPIAAVLACYLFFAVLSEVGRWFGLSLQDALGWYFALLLGGLGAVQVVLVLRARIRNR